MMGQHQISNCVICCESKPFGIHCAECHFTCRNCLSLYVKSCCDEAGTLLDNELEIKCPEFDCEGSTWDAKSLKNHITASAYHSLVTALTTLKEQSNLLASVGAVKVAEPSLSKSIVNCLNIACPKCDTVLDQTPDGCCAIRCHRCAAYFCWLCFAVCADNLDCHNHVTSCSLNSARREPFVPQPLVAAAHKRHKIGKIRQALRDHKSGKTRSGAEALQEVELLLRMNDISLSDL